MSARGTERARRHGSPTAIAAPTVSAMLGLRNRAVREAAAEPRRRRSRSGASRRFDVALALGVALDALVEIGDLGTAEQWLREADGEDVLPVQFVYTWALLGRGGLRLAQYLLDEAIADLEEVGRRGREGWRPWNPAMFPYPLGARDRAAAIGCAGSARRLAEEELELARRAGTHRAPSAWRSHARADERQHRRPPGRRGDPGRERCAARARPRARRAGRRDGGVRPARTPASPSTPG